MEIPASRRELIDERLQSLADEVDHEPLATELRHTTLSGGKRVRPLLTILSCEVAGGSADAALDYAVGIELVHTASLVVDDIIDESDLRRGVDSAWQTFGHGPAILASDGLLGEAFALFADDPRATRAVADAMVELGEGEATELAAEPTTVPEYIELARRKTGALFRAAAELGGVAAGADEATIQALGEYAERVGIAFQIRDDVLDATADTDRLGKPAGRDAHLDRPSIINISDFTPDQATTRAHQEAQAALDALDQIAAADPEAMTYLRDLAEFVVARDQ